MDIQNIPADHRVVYFSVLPGSTSAQHLDPMVAKRYGGYGMFEGVILTRYKHCGTHIDRSQMLVEVPAPYGNKRYHVDANDIILTSDYVVDQKVKDRMRKEIIAANADVFA